MPAPTHRIRSKSTPRGRSPNPKMLKEAHKKQKAQSRSAGKKPRKADAAFVTPPPKVKKPSPSVSSATSSASKPAAPRKISFGGVKETEIEAENQAPMEASEADKIFSAIKDLIKNRKGLERRDWCRKVLTAVFSLV